MIEIILSFLVAIRAFFRSRSDTALEVLALRQQLAVLKTETVAAKIELLGPTLLDGSPAVLVPVDRRSGSRETRHRDSLLDSAVVLDLNADNFYR